MDLATMLFICEKYTRLGGAIQDQISVACNGLPFNECEVNPNALEIMKDDFFRYILASCCNDPDTEQLRDEVQHVMNDIDSYMNAEEGSRSYDH